MGPVLQRPAAHGVVIGRVVHALVDGSQTPTFWAIELSPAQVGDSESALQSSTIRMTAMQVPDTHTPTVSSTTLPLHRAGALKLEHSSESEHGPPTPASGPGPASGPPGPASVPPGPESETLLPPSDSSSPASVPAPPPSARTLESMPELPPPSSATPPSPSDISPLQPAAIHTTARTPIQPSLIPRPPRYFR